ncbi:phosphatase PAP2 family protein [Sphingomonas panacisoli]|uniref:Acid phosphatase n=1 Tax=Sphingomonas panacisoli TaxID=1813879 RepID=A0A5B8LJH9_9SPHN|nr:phosphatase PAP2 family protein [Sphingomonas panacisoli]QDZ07915.1 phosphatase PAP2 family protein [Sphingomonas panacisoli]
MQTRKLIAAAFLLSASAGVLAKDKAPSLLSSADLDPQTVLPAPPAKGSLQGVNELRELHNVQRQRTPAAVKSAKWDSDAKSAMIFAEVLGPAFDLDKLPATKRLFDLVRATEKDVADRGKDEFKRPRPWIVDPTVKSCSRSDEPLSSYPSGHTTMAYSMAGVLARLVPAKASAIMARAARYGESRIVCEQHFRSDVTAGEALGLLVAERLMTKPEFVAAFDAAKAELRSVSLSGD